MQRIKHIDILRGIAILLVVFGHITHITPLRTYIWGFHIPIFFIISGGLFNKKKYMGTADFIKCTTRNLLFPYIFFYILTLLYWIFIEREVRGGDVSIISQLIGMVYGTYSMDYMMFNGALWFIPCLFSMELIYWFIAKIKDKRILIGILAITHICGIIFREWIGRLPFGLCASMIGILFYGVGHLLRKHLLTRNFINKKYKLVICIFCFAILQYLCFPYTGADLAGLKISYPPLYALIAFLGFGLYYMVSCLIGNSKWLEFLGANSLVIFALQEPVYRIVIFVIGKIFGMTTAFIRENVLMCLLCTLLSICIILPFISIYNMRIRPLLKRIHF